MIASLIAALCLGSPLSTPTRTSSARPEAGVQAAEAAASSARKHQVLSSSAAAATAAVTYGRSVHAQTSQAPELSPSW